MNSAQLVQRLANFITPRRVGLVAGGVLCLYLLGLAALPAAAVFWSPDEGGKYLTLRQGAITNPLVYPAAPIDPQLQQVPLLYWLRVDDAIYSWWPIWFPLITRWLFDLAGTRGLFLLPIGGALLTGLIIYRLVVPVSRRAALLAFSAATVASPLWFYGLTYWEHTLHTLLIVLGSAAAIRGLMRPQRRWWALSGVCLALALYLRLETVIYLAAIGAVSAIGLGRERRRVGRAALIFSGSFMLALAPFILHNQINEGHPLGRRAAADLARTADRVLAYGRDSALDIVPNLVVGSVGHQGVDLRPALRWLYVAAVAGCLMSGWLVRRGWEMAAYVAALTLLALSAWVLLSPEEYSSMHGLILIAPFLAFSGWSLRAADLETRLWGRLALAGAVCYAIATAIGGWTAQGGLQWGPRYALPLTALLMVALGRGLPAFWGEAALPIGARRVLLGAVIAAMMIGAGFQVRGFRTLLIQRQRYAAWEAHLRALPADAVLVTEFKWLALTLPDVYAARPMLLGQAATLPAEVRERAAQHGFTQLCQITIVQDQVRSDCTAVQP